MKHSLEWMPNTLFDMAAVCEKNGCDKPRDVLIETALMLHIYLANQEANDQLAPSISSRPSGREIDLNGNFLVQRKAV